VAHRLTRHLVLVGMTASGKTSVANEIARRLNVARLDTDDIVQIIDGRSVRDIFAEDGESKFRQIESQALMSALSRPEPSVIAVAAGAVTVESNREQLGDAAIAGRADIVWLRCDVNALLPRVVAEGHRPLLDNDAADTLQAMATTRTPLYEAVATHAVDTQGHDVARVAELVIELVNESMKG
jgi:shikimate kinase